ncbi:MAG: adenosylmethionine--8-amino-7-oxononanoate transaminase [Gammaproteobacteria bacterium]
MQRFELQSQLRIDREHVWHPYSTMVAPPKVFHVRSAEGVRLQLSDGREIIDGMSSWWSVIHGYGNQTIIDAIDAQLHQLPHVMFGGLTHEPAIELTAKLLEILPSELNRIFFADSGSVAVEVAIKMALQYWQAQGQTNKHRLLTVRGGYHGDTFGAMAVCDPVTGMHSLFSNTLPSHLFVPRPSCAFDDAWQDDDCDKLREMFAQHANEIAAFILEPIVQGAGGMWFYHPQYLRTVRDLCDKHDVLLICDEIATGFGRSGKMFASQHAAITPDILCIGKALTGGYMTLAATVATEHIAAVISSAAPGVFMHGPTFMANPLACSSAIASMELLAKNDWSKQVSAIETQLKRELAPCRSLNSVLDVRILGAIGVVELHRSVDMHTIPDEFVKRGVWLRPFGKLLYVMPPYIISPADLSTLTSAMFDVTKNLSGP